MTNNITKFLFSMLAMLLCIFSGCGSRSDTKPLAGTPGLVTFTVIAEDGETLLTGVKHLASGDTIVPPAAYTEVKGDSCVITCTKADKSITAYTADGRKIGDFEMFTPWNDTYCLGVRYVNKTYYFPATGEIITTRNSLHEPELIFLRTGTCWQIRTLKGELKSTVASDSLWIIRHAKIPTKLLIATTDTDVSFTARIRHSAATTPHPVGCTLYTSDGKLYKTLTPRQWKTLKLKFQNQQTKAETLTTADIAEFDSI